MTIFTAQSMPSMTSPQKGVRKFGLRKQQLETHRKDMVMTITSQVNGVLECGVGADDQEHGGQGAFLRSRLVLLAMVFALLFTTLPGVGSLGTQEAEASHGGMMTLRGKVYWNGKAQPGIPVHLYNSAGNWVRATTTDGYGNFAIIVGRDHSVYLVAHKVWNSNGSCPAWALSGKTGTFYLGYSHANPSYIDIYPTYWQVC